MVNFLVGQKNKRFIPYILSMFLFNLPLFIPWVMAHEVVKEEWVASYDSPKGGNDFITDLGLDSHGNIYVTGYSSGQDSAFDYSTIKYDPQRKQVWVNRYDSGAGDDKAQALAIENRDNIYVTGSSYNIDTSSYDFTTIKYDSDGNELWVARDDGEFEYFSRTYNGLNDQAYDVAIDKSGNVYVTGTSTGWCSSYPSDSCVHLLTSKHDSEGNQLWIKIHQLAQYPLEDVNSMTIAVDSMGNVYIGVNTTRGRNSIIKYDSDGNQLWKISRGYGLDIVVDSGDSLLVTDSSGTAKYDKDGNQLWSAEFGGRSLKIDSSDNVYVLTNGYGYVIKYDQDGNQIWQRPGKGEFGDYGGSNRSMTLDMNGNVYVSTDYSSDYITIKFDTEGNRLWVVRYDGGGSDRPKRLVVDINGNVYVAGSSGRAGDYSNSYNDYTIIKYSQINDNHPPYTPTILEPAHGSTGIAVNSVLSWSGGDPDVGDTVTYNLYFGTTSNPPEVKHEHGTTNYNPGTLNYSTTYYWQIVAFDNHGAFIVGPVWSFTTAQAPNNPPYVPSNPSPASEATNQPINTTLTWQGGDPDPGDTVTYDLYFGTSSTPSLIANAITNTSYSPGNLDYSTTYYWQIVARDNHGATSTSPIWKFGTAAASLTNNPPYTPSNPTPSNNATSQPVDLTLSWSGGDPDQGDTVSYDLYFGTSSSPSLVKSGLTEASYRPGILAYGTKYYWRVVAKDNHGAEAGGAVWSFITQTPPSQAPNTPTGFSATVEGKTVYIQWQANSETDIDHYNIYVGSSPKVYNIEGNPFNVGNATSLTVPDVPEGGYYLALSAVNSAGQESSLSEEIRVVVGAKPIITIRSNMNSYSPGDTLSLSFSLSNPTTTTQVVDIFLGIITPDGSIYFFDSSTFQRNLVLANANDPRTFTPATTSLELSPGYDFPMTPFFSVTLPTGLPGGTYQAFAALAEPGSVQTGSPRLVGDISLASFSFTR